MDSGCHLLFYRDIDMVNLALGFFISPTGIGFQSIGCGYPYGYGHNYANVFAVMVERHLNAMGLVTLGGHLVCTL